jgi:hypothetical protein
LPVVYENDGYVLYAVPASSVTTLDLRDAR